MTKNLELDHSFSKAALWRDEADALRQLLLSNGLDEQLKWGKPCYSSQGANICIIQRMKAFLALLFFKGGLLDDPDEVLEPQGPNSRQGYRMRFTSVEDVRRQAESLSVLLAAAKAVNDAGLTMAPRTEPDYPEELLTSFDTDAALRVAFKQLTPGRQRGYLIHFSAARQSVTRQARIDRNRQKILKGKGLNDRD